MESQVMVSLEFSKKGFSGCSIYEAVLIVLDICLVKVFYQYPSLCGL